MSSITEDLGDIELNGGSGLEFNPFSQSAPLIGQKSSPTSCTSKCCKGLASIFWTTVNFTATVARELGALTYATATGLYGLKKESNFHYYGLNPTSLSNNHVIIFLHGLGGSQLKYSH